MRTAKPGASAPGFAFSRHPTVAGMIDSHCHLTNSRFDADREAVIARAEPIERLHALTHGGKTLIDLPYGELGGGCKA